MNMQARFMKPSQHINEPAQIIDIISIMHIIDISDINDISDIICGLINQSN